jgi:hypothetical protein
VAGGWLGSDAVASVQLYDRTTGTWLATQAFATPRADHTMTLLGSGHVLAVGGQRASGAIATAER